MLQTLSGLVFALAVLQHGSGRGVHGMRVSVNELNETDGSLEATEESGETEVLQPTKASRAQTLSMNLYTLLLKGTDVEHESLHAAQARVGIKSGVSGDVEQGHDALKVGSLKLGGHSSQGVFIKIVATLFMFALVIGGSGYLLFGRPRRTSFRSQDMKRVGNVSLVERLTAVDFQSVATSPLDLLLPEWTEEAVMQLFAEHRMPCDKWTPDMVYELVQELERGQAKLVVRGPKLVHEVNMCMVFLVDKVSGRVLQEVSLPEEHPDLFDQVEMVPNSKMLSNESLHDAARRTLAQKLGIVCKRKSSSIVDVGQDCLFHITETEAYEKLPGLPCVTRKLFVSAVVQTTDEAQRQSIGLPDGILDVNISQYSWKAIQECSNIQPGVLNGLACVGAPLKPRSTDFGGLVLPWLLADVVEVMDAHGWNMESVEQTFGKPLLELTQLLKEGKITLAVDRTNGHLVCVEEAIVCVIRTPDGATLYEELPDSGSNVLPHIQKFSGESAWWAAMRWLRYKGGLLQPALQLSHQVYHEGHSGLVQQQDPVLKWHLDDALPHCVRRLFLVEGTMDKQTVDTSEG